MRMYEALSESAPSVAAAAGASPYIEWINGYVAPSYNTAWIYPQSDLETAAANIDSNSLLGPVYEVGTYSQVSYTKIDSRNYSFPTLYDAINFYIEMFLQTSVTQPLDNQGYSLGEGTVLRSNRLEPKLTLKLDSGIVIAQFVLMTQITSQSDLISGGNSPDGTIGWGAVYLDWNADGIGDLPTDSIPSPYVDSLRFKLKG